MESWTQTTYDDVNRRIVAKADLEAVGDAKKVATQFFDQLGRVRLAKTLEDASTQSATNETDGIKVQTRYKTVSGYTYQLSSNPYRASTSSAETDATMGWTRSKAWATGHQSQVETFSGATLPYPFLTTGYNTSSTGVVDTVTDVETATVTDQAGKLRRSVTNGIGQLVRVDEPNSSNVLGSVSSPNQATSYAYDTLNNLATVTQGSQTRTFTYSSLSRLLSATNPESGTISYEYDSNGNLTEKTDARAVVTNYDYDELNRVTDRTYTSPSPTLSNYQVTPNVEYTYGTTSPKVGRLTKVESTISTTEYTSFDILGRVTASKQTTDGVTYGNGSTDCAMTYTYNLGGALIEQQYPSCRVVKNELDVSGDLASVTSKENASAIFKTYVNDFTYNAAGAATSLKLGSGKYESTAFNSRLQPTQIALGHSEANTGLLKLGFTYGSTDNNGNVLTQTITVPGMTYPLIQTYSYDPLNRLDDANETSNGTQTWRQDFSYDRYGNRNFVEANTSFAGFDKLCNSNTELCSTLRKQLNPGINNANNNRINSGQDYSYDSSGNTLTDANGQIFVYDGENKQVKASNDSFTVGEYYYDGDGKRVKKVVQATGETTIFVYDAGGKLIGEYSTIVANATDAKVAYLTSDHLGSPRVNSDVTGSVIARHDYHPFGEAIAATGTRSSTSYGSDGVRNRFTGYERDDETELDFAQARMNATNLGRFTTVDPLLSTGQPADPQTWNRFSYVLNNPLNFIDPDGQCTAPALQKGQVGICYEAFIATKTVGGIGRGDNRGFNGNNGALTARVMISVVVSTDDKMVHASWSTKVWPSDVRIETNLTESGRIDFPMTSGYSSNVGIGTSLQGTADGNVELSNMKKDQGETDFGKGVDVTVSISNGKNGAQVSSNPLVRLGAPDGTIDGSVTLQISGSGNVKGVSANGRPFPSYAAYSYTLGPDGKTVITKRHLEERETPPVSNLTKPIRPLNIIQ